MALTFTAPAKLNPGTLSVSQVSVTLDASYSAGVGITLQQLGFGTGVVFGVVAIRTSTPTGPSGGTLDCSTPTAPKLKLQNAGSTDQLAAGDGAGAVIDIVAWGY
jgi:hypothetical protein